MLSWVLLSALWMRLGTRRQKTKRPESEPLPQAHSFDCHDDLRSRRSPWRTLDQFQLIYEDYHTLLLLGADFSKARACLAINICLLRIVRGSSSAGPWVVVCEFCIYFYFYLAKVNTKNRLVRHLRSFSFKFNGAVLLCDQFVDAK